jgi:hypothetical protein
MQKMLISRLPLPEAEHLIASIKAKGARLAVPGLVDLSEFAAASDGGAGSFWKLCRPCC